VPAALRAVLPADARITGRETVASTLLTDPMSVIPEQAVQWIAVAAALLAVLGFSVSLLIEPGELTAVVAHRAAANRP
jgi:hypothetical protein